MDFYYSLVSPCCQSVIFLSKKLELDLNLKKIDVHDPAERDELSKINPQHTIPTLDDHGHVVWESYAILVYLVEAYSNNDSLYPKDPKVRSVIHQRMFFDIGTYYKSFLAHLKAIIQKDTVTEEMADKLKKSVQLLESYLAGQSFVAADHLTIADFPLFVTTMALGMIKYDLSDYPKIQTWKSRVSKEIPGFTTVRREIDEAVKAYFAQKL